MEKMELRPPDKVNLLGSETGRDHLSTTKLSMALNCGRRYQFRYIEGLEPVSQAPALTLGKAFHAAIEARDAQVATDMLQSREAYDAFEQQRYDEEATIASAAVGAYLRRYPDEGITREYGYRVQLRSPYTGAHSRTFDLLGFADGVIDHGDHLELVEDKFTTRVDQVSIRKVRLDRQVSLEAYALWRVTGKPVKVVRYRFTKKPSIKQRKDETHPDFLARIAEDYRARPDFYLVEERSFRDERDLLEVEAELWDWAEQIRNAQHRGFFPRNTSHCADYGGCPFLDLCTLGAEARPLYRSTRQEIAA